MIRNTVLPMRTVHGVTGTTLLALFVELETATGLDKAEIFLFYMRWLNRTAPTPLSQMFSQFDNVAEHFAEPQIIAKLEEKFSQYASKAP